jgi:hypothetical protein
MTTDIKATRIALFALAVTAAVALAFYAGSSKSRLLIAVAAETCAPIPSNIKFAGPAMTIEQAEQLSLAEMTKAPPSVPRVPFGHLNSDWLALRQLARTGDTVHEFRTEISGGYLILRGPCLVGQLPEWIR